MTDRRIIREKLTAYVKAQLDNKAAGIGIAMGNALESLKQEANYITTTVDDDGVLNALRHFGLL